MLFCGVPRLFSKLCRYLDKWLKVKNRPVGAMPRIVNRCLQLCDMLEVDGDSKFSSVLVLRWGGSCRG